jgi:hypothetical protein
MIPKTIRRRDILTALKKIDEDGVPPARLSKQFSIQYNGRLYPPKYVVSLASQISAGKELYPSEFNGGKETNTFLQKLGYEITPVNRLRNEPVLGTKTSIVTVTVKSNSTNEYSNESRIRLLEKVIKANASDSVILFPGGFFQLPQLKEKKMIALAENVSAYLRKHHFPCVAAFGIDSEDGNDQLAVAVQANGILAIGRKFHPTKYDPNDIRPADSYNEMEMGYSRSFTAHGKRFYLAICYDGFGISQRNLPNPGVDAILILVHKFWPKGKGISGDVDYARKGFAGASLQWNCPAFGTAVFFDREIPVNWPTGVLYKDVEKGVKHFMYQDNELRWIQQDTVEASNEQALCYLYLMD